MLNTQEHADLIAHFEKVFRIVSVRATKEAREHWRRGNIYCHGETNQQFLAFRQGYAFAKSVYQGGGDLADVPPRPKSEE